MKRSTHLVINVNLETSLFGSGRGGTACKQRTMERVSSQRSWRIEEGNAWTAERKYGQEGRELVGKGQGKIDNL